MAFELPPGLREKMKRAKKKMSPAAYEKLRERVKGPEDLEKELGQMEHLANLKFNMESEPHVKEKLKEKIKEDIDAKGMDEVLAGNLEEGDFDVSIEENPDTHEDQLVVAPEGNVSEKIVIKPAYSEQYIAQFSHDSAGTTG
tara:strand:- start:881 stop:1306 length:426 start_codon:yes stop_codon:yes gene_type:complete